MAVPVAVFAFNRPYHLRRCLESLRTNPEAPGSHLIVFSDGPRIARDEGLVADVRRVARERAWCGVVDLITSEENKGLAKSIIGGVTALCREYGRVIVLEDDLEVSGGFLKYMTHALDHYEQEASVMQVSGHCFPAAGYEHSPACSFLPVSTTWGWATWKRAWEQLDVAMTGSERLRSDRSLRLRFDLGGSYPYSKVLEEACQEGEPSRSWGILWYWSVFRSEGLVLYPHRTLVRNFGDDGSGTNVKGWQGQVNAAFSPENTVRVWPQAAEVDGVLYAALQTYHRTQRSPLRRAVRLLKRLSTQRIWHE